MKRFILWILAACMVFTGLCVSGVALADTQSEGFSYVLLEDGTASITKCSLKGDVVIPSVLDGYTVTNLKAKLFYGSSRITSVFIPATVTGFGTNPEDNKWDYVFSYCYDLEKITVDEANPVFSSKDGVLFSKDGKILFNYPCNKAGKSYHVPEEVKTLCCTSFASNRNLRKLYLDGMNTTWAKFTFFDCGKLTVYYQPNSSSEIMARQEAEDGRSHETDSTRPTFRSIEEEEPDTWGWMKTDAGWIYVLDEETNATGWFEDGGKWYFFSDEGIMKTGWICDGGTWYYMNASGVMQTGWITDGSSWYCMAPDGGMRTGWIQSGGRWYYLASNGVMKTGWLKDGGSWYYFGSDGAMITGWVKDSGSWYYFDASGTLVTGWQQVNGKWYYFKSTGAMQTGWFEDRKAENKLPADQKHEIWYWFDSSGAMATGWKEINGQWEMFAASGEWLYTWQGE